MISKTFGTTNRPLTDNVILIIGRILSLYAPRDYGSTIVIIKLLYYAVTAAAAAAVAGVSH